MKKSFILSIFILVIFVTGCASHPNKVSSSNFSSPTQASSPYSKKSTPTVFFHGYSGGRGSFGSMLKRLESNGLSKKQLTLTVREDGTILQEGTWDKDQFNPTIQVLFENNRSTQWNQSTWIKAVFSYLYTTYDVKEGNIVGHSMGSVSTLDYLERFSETQNQPEIKKVVFIAGPFNDFIDTFTSQSKEELLENGPNKFSTRYSSYLSQAADIPKQIAFQVISGQLSENELTDEAVPLSSSLSIIPILKKQGFQVESVIIKGKKAQHSQLHENKEVDDSIRQFLWGKE